MKTATSYGSPVQQNQCKSLVACPECDLLGVAFVADRATA